MAIEIEQPTVPLSRVAVSETHGEDSPYFAGWKAYDEDPYDESENPSGVIQMGLAENQVSFSLSTKLKLSFRPSISSLIHRLMQLYNNNNLILSLVNFIKQVSFDLVEEYLEKHPEASTWGKGAPGFRENALFQDYHGLKSFRQVLACSVYPRLL